MKFMLLFLGFSDRTKIKEKVTNLLWEYDLQDCANIIAMQLTKTQRKRLSLALSLLGDTKVVLLDEPTAEMDISTKQLMWEII